MATIYIFPAGLKINPRFKGVGKTGEEITSFRLNSHRRLCFLLVLVTAKLVNTVLSIELGHLRRC